MVAVNTPRIVIVTYRVIVLCIFGGGRGPAINAALVEGRVIVHGARPWIVIVSYRVIVARVYIFIQRTQAHKQLTQNAKEQNYGRYGPSREG